MVSDGFDFKRAYSKSRAPAVITPLEKVEALLFPRLIGYSGIPLVIVENNKEFEILVTVCSFKF